MKQQHCGPKARTLTEEKRLASRELLIEAWEEGVAAGIEPELMAEEMTRAVLGEFERARGQIAAMALSERLVKLVSEGQYLATRILQ